MYTFTRSQTLFANESKSERRCSAMLLFVFNLLCNTEKNSLQQRSLKRYECDSHQRCMKAPKTLCSGLTTATLIYDFLKKVSNYPPKESWKISSIIFLSSLHKIRLRGMKKFAGVAEATSRIFRLTRSRRLCEIGIKIRSYFYTKT